MKKITEKTVLSLVPKKITRRGPKAKYGTSKGLPVGFYTTVDIVLKLDKIAEQENITRSELLNTIINKYADKYLK